METKRPLNVTVGGGGSALSIGRGACYLVAAIVLMQVLYYPSWVPLVAAPMLPVLLIYPMRLSRSRAEFWPQTVVVRAILRRTEVNIADVTMIALASHPGVAYIRAQDGGSAMVSTGRRASEFDRERRVRLHDVGMLRLLYQDTPIVVTDVNATGTVAMNRTSSSVKFSWIAPTRTEVVIVLGALALGVLCYFV